MGINNAEIKVCEEGIFITGEKITIENSFIQKCDEGVMIIPNPSE